MWGHCISQHKCNLSFESTASTFEKISFEKQVKVEKRLSLDSDTDFQSFILPLEQDFTKSSKGYASLLSVSPDKEKKSTDYKNELEETKMNILPNENFSDSDHLRNTSEKLHNSSYSSSHCSTKDADNLYYEKCTQFIHDTLENIKDVQTGVNMFDKKHTKASDNSTQNFHNGDHISETKENIMYVDKCEKTTHEFSIKLFKPERFSDKSDDDSSDSSETGSFDNGCNDSLNFDDDSSSDNSIIFSEDDKIKNWISSIEIKQTLIREVTNSDNSERSDNDDCLKESEERTSFSFSDDFAFNFDSDNILQNLMPSTSQRNLCDPLIAYSSEGYINASFEDDDFEFEQSSLLKNINDSWNDSMKDISGEPHESRKVSFVPLPDLVSVFSYEPEDDDYCYSLYVLDQLRFQSRIKDFESVIAPYLTPEYRASIYQRNYLQD